MEYEIKPAGRFSFNLKELADYRELIYFFVWRDIKVKYKQTVLGAAWVVLQPLVLMIIFTFVFSKALSVETGGNLPYPVFVYSGLLMWTLFSSSVTSAGNSMVSNAGIIKKIYFPRLIIPLSSVVSSMADFFVSLLIYILLIVYFGYAHILPMLLAALPVALFIVVCTSLGLGSWLAALNVKYRDFKYIIPFMIQILMFCSPVIYPVTIIGEGWLRDLLMLNPLAGAIDLLRAVITEQPPNLAQAGRSMLIALGFVMAGVYYFRKTEYYFADLA